MTNTIFVLFFLIFSQYILVVLSQPISTKERVSAFVYLDKFGYIEHDGLTPRSALMSDEVISESVKKFQTFAGLEPTGELDELTIELIHTPRCGVVDVLSTHSNAKRKKRYAPQGSKWSKNKLTWRITSYPSSGDFKKPDIDAQMKTAFEMWSNHTKLEFEQRKSGSADIYIQFQKGKHGDGDPFDGEGGTLAHAFFPEFGGGVHFDDEEIFTIDKITGTNLLQTAAHEFGHSLGLKHSDVREALMAPFYKPYDPNLALHQDDIDGIQALYGALKIEITEETQPPPENTDELDNAELCDDTSVDDIFGTKDGSFYVFKGANYWKMSDTAVYPGYPKKIADDWPGLPNDIDAAFLWKENGKTYFFKNDDYWAFENQTPLDNYPKKISDSFKGIPNNIDTAFTWSGNGKIYFFKGDEYWKFDPSKPTFVSKAYPRNIKSWHLPGDIDAAVQWNNKRTYFFKKGDYWKFNDKYFNIDANTNLPFPRSAGIWWFGCPQPDLGLRGEDGEAITIIPDLSKQNPKEIESNFDYVQDNLIEDVLPPDE